MTKEQVRKEIFAMRYNYARLQGKAMDDGDEILAAQNTGAYLALDLLLDNLGMNDAWDDYSEELE